MGSIRRHAEAIARDPKSSGYGFPIALLIPVVEFLGPIFLKCIISKMSESATAEQKAAEVKRVAESSWNGSDYDKHVLRQMRPHTYNAMITGEVDNRIIPRDANDVDNVSRLILDRARGVDMPEIQEMVNEVCPVIGEITLDETI